MCEVHLNTETGKIETVLRKPQPPAYNFAVSIALPMKAKQHSNEIFHLIDEYIRSSSTLDDVLNKMTRVISVISDMDETVGKKVSTLTLTKPDNSKPFFG